MESDSTDQLKKDSQVFLTYPNSNMNALWDMTSSTLNITHTDLTGQKVGMSLMATLSLCLTMLGRQP